MYKKGFTLIEILVAIVVIAIMATILIPNLRPRAAGSERKQFVNRLNALMRVAQHHARMTQKTHKIMIDLEKKMVQLHVETTKKDAQGQPIFEPARGAYITTQIPWPAFLQAKNIFIEGYDELERRTDRTTNQIWFFVAPSGLAQTVTINMLDTKDKRNNKPRSLSLVLNPFSAQFKQYDVFQKK